MSKERVSLSFFKDSKIDYFYDNKEKTITFPCFKCESHAIMNVVDTSWNCSSGCSKGNIFELIKTSKESIIEKSVYNPKKEFKRIEYRFNKLSKTGNKEIEELRDIVYGLINYYKSIV
ncbi:hypothetical protein [Neobacillus sp. SuZ13]|uniref:hypothetical protein n=1 Tax=Neobacillus sp. SuZ13 TaxID=3047875 RepID=UPI0024BFAC8C|nr:hypothetical protein [Neobacillus sp. SuZ13]WHY65378.1 hypothetical protein QNH17_20105 [Neobacillus sp. SuZ13]